MHLVNILDCEESKLFTMFHSELLFIFLKKQNNLVPLRSCFIKTLAKTAKIWNQTRIPETVNIQGWKSNDVIAL